MGAFLRDLFMGPGNKAWELARFIAAWAVLSYSAAFLYSVFWLHQAVEWSSLGTGFGAVLLGAFGGVGLKDFAAAKASATAAATPEVKP